MEELAKNEAMTATHPVVRYNPDTGRKVLFVPLAFTKRLKGWTEKESQPFLTYLHEHSTQAHLGCRLARQPKPLVMWGNQALLHQAVADYFGEVAKHRRVMPRVTIEGEVAIAARAAPAQAD